MPSHRTSMSEIPHACAWALLVLFGGGLGCTEERVPAQPEPVYEGDVGALLEARCGGCHGDEDAGAGYRIDSYARALRCAEGSPDRPATAQGDTGAALLDVLERPSHAELLSERERTRIARWVERDAPQRASAVHASGILNPRSQDWHGRLAATDRFAPITERDHALACGRCHAGAPVTPPGVQSPAPGAPACTSCHNTSEGVLACGTCHGDGAARAFPPRDRCAFEGPERDAHRAHVTKGALGAEPIACSACHPSADRALRGTHANGTVEVRLDPALAGDDASYDAASGTCSVSCHARGGARPSPRFDEAGPLRCSDCHGAPPADHFAGACDDCHPGVNAQGTALSDARLHLNGVVDIGGNAGSAQACSACHGQGEDPMPSTGAHLAHARTELTAPIACEECHRVPDGVLDEGHLDRGEPTPADVTFGGRAHARDRAPSYAAGSCREVACHGAGLFDDPGPLQWTGDPIDGCTSCHGAPPGGDHPSSPSCAATLCHGSEVTASSPPALTPSGQALHIDGALDLQRP
jgi:predicted CxxxxCH...CXXCH cytochrome family protein